MVQSALDASTGISPDFNDFDSNYDYVKVLIKLLKSQDGVSVKEALFGVNRELPKLTKTRMKQMATSLRKIKRQYDQCSEPAPIPDELAADIRSRETDVWLPWEIEAMEKLEVWRDDLQKKKDDARKSLRMTIERFRDGKA